MTQDLAKIEIDEAQSAQALDYMGTWLLLPVRVRLKGYVLSTLWGWFVVPTFEIPGLPVVPAMGLSLIAGFLTHQHKWGEPSEPQSLDRVTRAMMQSMLYPILTIASYRREKVAEALMPNSDTRTWLRESRLRLIEALKLVYRKHVLNDNGVGWQELEEKLLTELTEAMGDKAFQRWLSAEARADI